MRSKLFLVAVMLVGARAARADEARPRSIWLECKAPAVWPKAGSPVRLSCRVDGGAPGPAFWQTVNPFRPDPSNELMDPFEIVPAYLDLFDSGRPRTRSLKVARPRPPAPLTDELMSPFEAIPDSATDTMNPFDSPQKEAPVERPPR